MLLHRLRRQGLVDRQLSFARSTQASDGLTVTKPRPVWMVPQRCRNTLRKHLAQAGRRSEADRFDACAQSNHAQSFSEQALAHEIGISSLLMGFEQAAENKAGLHELKWLRSSPRHELTSHKVQFRLNGKVQAGHINPDALVFLIMEHELQRYPFLFFLEFERGTAPPAKYAHNKLAAYAALAAQMRAQHENYKVLLERLNAGLHLGLSTPATLPFRVLTVARSGREAADLLTAAATLNEPKLFNFSALEDVSRDTLGAVWLRQLEYSAEDKRGRNWQNWYQSETTAATTRTSRLDALWESVPRIALP